MQSDDWLFLPAERFELALSMLNATAVVTGVALMLAGVEWIKVDGTCYTRVRFVTVDDVDSDTDFDSLLIGAFCPIYR